MTSMTSKEESKIIFDCAEDGGQEIFHHEALAQIEFRLANFFKTAKHLG